MSSPAENDRSLIPLLITSMAVFAPLLFILGLVVGNHLQGNASLTADSISSWLSAIATVAIAILTFILAKETWYLREAQIRQLDELKRENIRPSIGIQLDSSPVGMNFIDAKITNTGKGIAKKVRFSFKDRYGAAVPPGQDPVSDKFLKLSMFSKGIETVGIGQTLSSFVFSFLDLGNELGGKIFEPYLSIIVDFEDVEGNKYQNTFEIDFSQYEGVSHLGGADAVHKISDEIKKIRELLGKVVKTSRNRLEVDVFDEADRKAENELIQRRHEEALRKHGGEAA
jgi:hypothetical protein